MKQATAAAGQPAYMFCDQWFDAARRDVLRFISGPLPDDLTVAGPVSPRSSVSTSGTDSGFDVKLIDVYPGGEAARSTSTGRAQTTIPNADAGHAGYEELIRGEPMRARFRQSMSKPDSMIPNRITPLDFDMPDVNHTFLCGHRIMVEIQSSWFPLTDLNPQSFVDPAIARHSDFRAATDRVYHTATSPSAVIVGVLPKR
ncbi:MAG TPA: CocE/NonD family hydrolase C-terminal non-catalytic domain-containing protein [Gemmatimonadaceae bacterium]|nr:CocE/NonD family hydrolase C-terminal non-catalytic domain-containing protein [Gemmatimonadaceae bacterium]